MGFGLQVGVSSGCRPARQSTPASRPKRQFRGPRHIALTLAASAAALCAAAHTYAVMPVTAEANNDHASGEDTADNANKQSEDSNRDESALTVDHIFGSKEFRAERLDPFVWSKQDAAYFTLEKPGDDGAGRDLVRVDAASGSKEILAPASAFVPPGNDAPLAIDGFQFSGDESKVLIFTNSRRVWRYKTRGDYWVLDLDTRELTAVGGDAAPSTLKFAKFSPDGTQVAYVHKRNIYVQDLHDMSVTPLTTDGSARVINGTGDWVNEEELGIRDGYRWSPDGQSIAFWQFDTTNVGRFHLLDNTAGAYPEIKTFAYPKVGTTNSATRVGVVGIDGGGVRWMELPGDRRQHYVPRLGWTPDGGELLIQQMNRAQETNRVMLADPETGSTRTVLTETDEAFLEDENPVRWVNDGRGFLWLSERDGWRHACLAGVDNGSLTKLTAGDFDVIRIEGVDRDRGWVYFAASPDEPTERYLYRVSLDGGKPQRITPPDRPGWHTYDIAPNGKWATHTWSTFTTPPVVELVRLKDHSAVRVLVNNKGLREKLAALRKPSSEFFRIEIGNGISLDAWGLKPPDLDPTKQYPLLFYVYGEPYAPTVRNTWHGARGLWHWMLAQEGYLVASVDNRGTRVPRGRAWRKAINHRIGILPPKEQAAAARRLLERWRYADPERIGIWGWSGGGSNALHAIFRYPDLYDTAIAVAPNPDQRLYDTIYQERYMGLPEENPEAYRRGSPITHAEGLQGNLLIVHGTGDDNGHYQGTEMLMNELIAQGKQFDVMPYPARTHAISEGANTVSHFNSLLTDYLHEHLPLEKPRTRESAP